MEQGVLRDLNEAGFDVSYQQVLFTDEKLQIRGRVDCYLSLPGDPVLDRAVPTEIKGLHPSYCDKVTSFESCYNSDRPWLRLYPGQMLAYATLPGGRPWVNRQNPNKACPLVAMVIRNKASRETRFILEETADHQHEIDRIHSNLRSVNWHISRGKVPPAMEYSPTFCDGCDFAHICPTMKKIMGDAEVLTIKSPELDSILTTMEANKAGQKAYDAAQRKRDKMIASLGWTEGPVGKVRTIVTEQFRFEVKVTERTARDGDDLRPKIKVKGKKVEFSRISSDDE